MFFLFSVLMMISLIPADVAERVKKIASIKKLYAVRQPVSYTHLDVYKRQGPYHWSQYETV